jgi:hypothetical protein
MMTSPDAAETVTTEKMATASTRGVRNMLDFIGKK